MGNIHNRNIIHFQDDVVDLHAAVDRSRSAWDDLRQTDGWIVADVWVVSSTRNAKTQTRAASLKNNFLVIPCRFIASIRL